MSDVPGVNELFDQLSELQREQSLPPVHSWHPEHVGEIDIRIAADGTWYHEGDPITRIALAKVFSTVLRKDDDGFWLVTPAEKLHITVDDAPFIAVDFEVKGAGRDQQLLFITNFDDSVVVDAEHPIWLEGTSEEPRPYVHVRDGLNALITRSAFYRLIDLCEVDSAGIWITSCGERFQLG